jgi:hypothetical protein
VLELGWERRRGATVPYGFARRPRRIPRLWLSKPPTRGDAISRSASLRLRRGALIVSPMAVGLALGTKRLRAVRITTVLRIAIVIGFFVKRLIVDVPHLAAGTMPTERLFDTGHVDKGSDSVVSAPQRSTTHG